MLEQSIASSTAAPTHQRFIAALWLLTCSIIVFISTYLACALQIVLIEEAAEVMEPHILASLAPSTEHLILIGDHEQLRPKAQLYEMQVCLALMLILLFNCACLGPALYPSR